LNVRCCTEPTVLPSRSGIRVFPLPLIFPVAEGRKTGCMISGEINVNAT
jgi:hypothetical protein